MNISLVLFKFLPLVPYCKVRCDFIHYPPVTKYVQWINSDENELFRKLKKFIEGDARKLPSKIKFFLLGQTGTCVYRMEVIKIVVIIETISMVGSYILSSRKQFSLNAIMRNLDLV